MSSRRRPAGAGRQTRQKTTDFPRESHRAPAPGRGGRTALGFLFSTGARRGEALGLRWDDVDFESYTLTIRRSITVRRVTTPKSGRARSIRMSPTLASELFDLLGLRRRESLYLGRPEVPAWVFCSTAGTPLEGGNVTRVWLRLRRRAQAQGIRPLRLHDARHTWATHALAAGKSIRWVADQLGHADPALTLRVYAHALNSDESDLSFADFGAPERPYTAPRSDRESASTGNPLKFLAPPGGLEPPTHGLGNRRSIL